MDHGKMKLGGSGLKDSTQAQKGTHMQKQGVQVVVPRPAGSPAKPTSEPIQGCCGHSSLKMAGMKK